MDAVEPAAVPPIFDAAEDRLGRRPTNGTDSGDIGKFPTDSRRQDAQSRAMKTIRLTLAVAAAALLSVPSVAQRVDLGNRSMLEVATQLKNGEYAWAPELSAEGPALFVVNLHTQRAVLFRAGRRSRIRPPFRSARRRFHRARRATTRPPASSRSCRRTRTIIPRPTTTRRCPTCSVSPGAASRFMRASCLAIRRRTDAFASHMHFPGCCSARPRPA